MPSSHRRTVLIVAQKAIERLRKRFDFQDSSTLSTPAIREDLEPTEAEKESIARDVEKGVRQFPQRSLVGGLTYIGQTETVRPDIVFAVSRCPSCQAHPSVPTVNSRPRSALLSRKGIEVQRSVLRTASYPGCEPHFANETNERPRLLQLPIAQGDFRDNVTVKGMSFRYEIGKKIVLVERSTSPRGNRFQSASLIQID